jgi:hypothetical protein
MLFVNEFMNIKDLVCFDVFRQDIVRQLNLKQVVHHVNLTLHLEKFTIFVCFLLTTAWYIKDARKNLRDPRYPEEEVMLCQNHVGSR